MTPLLVLVAFGVAVVAAVRSTWSPCGLSMLSTITPLSETAKGNSYRATATWFTIGSTVGGLTLGAGAALGAAAVRALGASSETLLLLAAAAAWVALCSDVGVGGFGVPIHRRQVNERWLDHYRSWVYGAGFGWQIGVGLATYITSAAVYLTVVLAVLTASPMAALAVGGCFGLVRGLAVFLTRSISAAPKLLDFHRRLSAAAPKARRLVVVVEGAAAVALAAAAWPPGGLVALVAIAGSLAIGRRSSPAGEGALAGRLLAGEPGE